MCAFSVTRSLKDPFQIIIDGATKAKKPCRIWTTVLDRKDGSYIVRYKVYESCTYMKISIIYKDEHVAKSPYIINNIIYPDDCMCPVSNINELIESWECGLIPTEITERLKIFEKINWDEYRERVSRSKYSFFTS